MSVRGHWAPGRGVREREKLYEQIKTDTLAPAFASLSLSLSLRAYSNRSSYFPGVYSGNEAPLKVSVVPCRDTAAAVGAKQSPRLEGASSLAHRQQR